MSLSRRPTPRRAQAVSWLTAWAWGRPCRFTPTPPPSFIHPKTINKFHSLHMDGYINGRCFPPVPVIIFRLSNHGQNICSTFSGNYFPPHGAAVKEPELQHCSGRVSPQHCSQLDQRVQEMAEQHGTRQSQSRQSSADLLSKM